MVGVVGGQRYGIAFPLLRRRLDALSPELPHRFVVVLRVGVGVRDAIVPERQKLGDLQPLLEGGSLVELLDPRLDVWELARVDAAPLGTLRVDVNRDVGYRQTVPGYEGGGCLCKG